MNRRRAVYGAAAQFLLIASPMPGNAATVRGTALAPNNNACTNEEYAIGFFNGIFRFPDDAAIDTERLASYYGPMAADGKSIRYIKFYNATNGLNDVLETFAQRLAETPNSLKNRFELFFETVSGSGPYIDAVKEAYASYSAVTDSVSASYKSTIRSNYSVENITRITALDYVKHQKIIDRQLSIGRKLIFFAHSQGNLFANKAFIYARNIGSANAVRVQHVAPASNFLNGPYVLADGDTVINGLLAGISSAPPPNTGIPDYLLRPASPYGGTDIFGHGFAEIYLNTRIPSPWNNLPSPSTKLRADISTAFATFASQPSQKHTFTVTLKLDGPGKLALQLSEPGPRRLATAADPSDGTFAQDGSGSTYSETYAGNCRAGNPFAGDYSISFRALTPILQKTELSVTVKSDGILLTFFSLDLSPNAAPTPAGVNNGLGTVRVSKNVDGTNRVIAFQGP